MRQYELVERVKAYDPAADEVLLNRAYVFAMKAHGSQKRASGDPYFSHPVEVAGILTGLKLDTASIATALLHDTVEDTGTSLDDIEKLFGIEIRRLVDGVTKLSKLELQSARTAQAENFRKLLLAMSVDIRVLLVKLADRLHNMRTLHFCGEEKRRRIARETIDIYAPLAERIGMQGMKDELEDLAFMHLWPDARASVIARLERLRADDGDLVLRICQALRTALYKEGVDAEVNGREKAPISIWRKMQRKNVSFEQLSDIMAFRVVVDTVGSCYAALGAVHGEYVMKPGRFKDFISTPKPNGYRSLHTTIIGPEGRAVEVQIRTREMQEVAELGVAAHWAYKQGNSSTDGTQYRWIRELLDILEHASGPEEFLEHTKLEMFQDQVFCFSPKGDLYALPQGATPIDFAYAVHSDIGDSCTGAKVDGRIVQLRTKLDNGNQVEILTGKSGGPRPSWERYVVTARARARVRRFLRLQKRNEYLVNGRDVLHRVAQREGVTWSEKQMEAVLPSLPYATVDDVVAAIGEGKLSARQVMDAMHPELRHAAEERPNEETSVRPSATDGKLPLRGLPEGVASTLARCCNPVPGEPIVGVVRTGREVSIHRADCPNVGGRTENGSPPLELDWEETARQLTASGRVRVLTMDQPGSLGAMTTLIGNQGGNITMIQSGKRSGGLLEVMFEVEVEDIDHLRRLIGTLQAMPVVSQASRARG
ncbi:RelA/SpoT family protein [Marinivivus vitaminiproducens]|uniref:RelA/SpoT family protein n=1 Tax=Marinivivus vitaminiproducens TaxID=3035935 RepID=UPI0027A3AFE4|nr:bifunctional (p)ppGpp synthetase/guanosine-3',5'-bis(diphosphate) 3'-pyrophosphohydrolase [Geminicoccaceae bacterium SCSIO 64248]